MALYFKPTGRRTNRQVLCPRPSKNGVVWAALLIWLWCGNGPTEHLAAETISPAHRHLRLSNVIDEVIADVEIVEVVLDKTVMKANLVRSRDGKHRAFAVTRTGDVPGETICFESTSTGRAYEVRGLPFSHRPFSDLRWSKNSLLVFDRWSQPHYGIHYVVDVKRRRLVKALAFPDEFFLKQQKIR